MERAFVSWSGGKDCCLAYYRASTQGLKVTHAVNMVTQDRQVSCSHGLAAKWLQMQTQAMEIQLVQQPTTSTNYEAMFKKTIAALKQEGITTGVFGDIDFNAHREWIDRVCSAAGIAPHLPLWLEDQNKLLREFIASGFEAVVVATRAELLGEEWLGRSLDSGFVADLARLGNITPCGEAGEYHTLVINGPLFQKRLEITETKKVLKDGHWFLDIAECELKSKRAEKV